MYTINESTQQNHQNDISPWVMASHQQHRQFMAMAKKIPQKKDTYQLQQVPRSKNKTVARYESSPPRTSLPSVFVKQLSLEQKVATNSLKRHYSTTNPNKYFSRKHREGYDYFLRKTLQTPAVCNRIKSIVKNNLFQKPTISHKPKPITVYPSEQLMKRKSIDFQYETSEVTKKQKVQPSIKEKKHILDQILERWW